MTHALKAARRTSLYRYFACDETLLYIGIAYDPDARAKQHAATKSWWANVDHSRTLVVWFDDRESAASAELAAIRNERPLHNIVTSDENGCAKFLPQSSGWTWAGARHPWTPDTATEAQLRLREAVAVAARKAQEADDALLAAVQAAHEAGVPMDDLAEQAGHSRATLFRRVKTAKP